MHTPGPWQILYPEAFNFVIVSKDRPPIAVIHGLHVDYEDSEANEAENLANAKLIAAAPDMFAVLKEAVDHAHVYDTNPALIELFKAVISKIENK